MGRVLQAEGTESAKPQDGRERVWCVQEPERRLLGLERREGEDGVQLPGMSSGDGEGAGLTLRAAPGERACRGGNGGGEVSQEAPARVLRRLGDAQTGGVTCEQGEGMT